MISLRHTLLFFLIIVIEGYVVLSTELLAIRQTIPHVGSGTDTISIIIAAVLMPLAFGYQYGGRFKTHKILGYHITIRKKLIINILISSTILLVGMSYEFLDTFFQWLTRQGVHNRITQTAIYASLFLVIPIYLLGQTVPLISNYFSKQRLAKITGKILFFSTVGSFLGAIFSTLVLMAMLGVHHTVSLNFILMTILVVLLVKKKNSRAVYYSALIALCALYLNSNDVMRKFHIKKNNQYNTIIAGTQRDGNRLLKINGNYSSQYNDKGHKFRYIEFAEDLVIDPIAYVDPPKDILVIGAGGFTFGHDDKTNNYIYIDIDKDLLEVAERHILKEPIGENKTFIPQPARAYLNGTDKKFDVIYLDTYLGGVTIPEHLVTQEFFMQVKDHLKDGGIMMANLILSPNFTGAFSRNIDATLRSVFPHLSRHVVDEYYNLWNNEETFLANVAYIYRHQENFEDGKVYTDNKNTVFYDKTKRMLPN